MSCRGAIHRIGDIPLAVVSSPSSAVREAQCALERFLFADDNFARAVAITTALAGWPAAEERPIGREGSDEILEMLGTLARARFTVDEEGVGRSIDVLARVLELSLELRSAIQEEKTS